MRTRFYLHVGLWVALFAAFIAFSLPTVGPAALENKFGPVEPNHSTDSYLSGLTRVRDGTALFSRLIGALPRDKSLAIFVNAGSSPSEFLGMLVAYLTWPRDVQIVHVNPSTYASELERMKQSSATAVILCNLKPPVWMQGTIPFGSNITVVPVDALHSNQ